MRLLAAGAGVVIAAATAAAQDAPTACGPAMRRSPATAADIDSVMRSRSVLQMQRMTSALRASGIVGGGRVQIGSARGWLGIRTSEVSELRVTTEGRLVRYCDYPVVVSVEPGSPAAQAGVEAGDTIVAYNGADLRSAGEVALDRLLVPGDTLRVSVRREGRTVVTPVVVGRAPALGTVASGGPGFSYVIVGPSRAPFPIAPMPPTAPDVPMADARPHAVARRTREIAETAALPPLPALALGFGLGGVSAVAGAQVIAMDEDLRAAVGARSGVLVLKVAEGTPASEAGLRSGDVIVTVDGLAATSPLAIQQAMLRGREDRAVALRVERRGRVRDVALRW